MTTQAKLTVEACRALQPGQTIKCHVVRGLQLRATATGKTWLVYHRVNGQQRRPAIGYFPALTVELARDAARALLAAVARGGDPSADRRKARHAPTVAALCARYIEHKAETNKPRTMDEIKRHCRYIEHSIGRMLAADVTAADCARVIAYVAQDRGSPVAANRVRETLRGMLSYAETSSLKWRERNSNPVSETLKQRERKRRVIVQPSQFPAIMSAMDHVGRYWPDRVAALRCILMSGTRVSEMLSADRAEWQGDKLVLAEHKTDRTGDDRIIYLPRQAQEIIAALPVYPSGKLWGDLDRFNIYHAWELVRDIAKCPELTVRDFRRTFASIALSRGGASLDQIGELFSHKDTSTTAGYAWLADADATALAQRTADEMSSLGGVETKSK